MLKNLTNQSCIVKARVKTVRIGLIVKQEKYWKFSTAFANAMRNLIQKIVAYQALAINHDEREREKMHIEMAKGLRAKKPPLQYRDMSDLSQVFEIGDIFT